MSRLDPFRLVELCQSTWAEMDAEVLPQYASKNQTRVGATLLVALVCLILIEYVGMPMGLEVFAGAHAKMWSPDYELITQTWWAIWGVIGFFVFPALFLKLQRQRLTDYGLAWGNSSQYAGLIAISLAIMLPIVYAASLQPEFSSYYPFYSRAGQSWRVFLFWEALYLAQFVALEFFFRGFLIQGTKTAFGRHAILISTIPYVIIHFGKPLAETLAAIFAGLFLGTLAVAARSVWPGFILHGIVALAMDVFALLQRSVLPQ